MKIKTKPFISEDFSQASFAPYTRGYNAIPKSISFETNIDLDAIYILRSYTTEEIAALLKETASINNPNILLAVPITEINFIAVVRSIRTLFAVMDAKNEVPTKREARFTIQLSENGLATQEIYFAQLAQIDTVWCTNESVPKLKLILPHLPTPPIDAFYGSLLLTERTNHFMKNVSQKLFDN